MFDNLWKFENKDNNRSSINSAILASRGIEDVPSFLNPSLEALLNPFTINEMDKTVKRIITAIYNMEKIIIYGDYDVDGITSTTILMKFIREFTSNIEYYIPHRVEQGYGLSDEGANDLIKMKGNLIITVDCGILSFKQVDFLNEHHIDVIITDHHKAEQELPDAFSVLCCTRGDNTYKNPTLSSSGLTYKIVEALNIKMCLEKDLSEYLQLATLGLVADVVPLIGETRIMVKHGLKLLENTRIEGIKALFEICGIKKGETLTPYHLGYIVCPRINAAGRMDHAKFAVEMLLENSTKKAHKYAEHFDQLNKERQISQEIIYQEVIEKINSDQKYNDQVIVVENKNWNHAIIGIVASKISEAYNKPVILMEVKENIAKGSARSIDGFSIIDAINFCSDYLLTYGGHDKAAGVSLEVSNVELFRKEINNYFSNVSKYKPKELKIDLELYQRDITYENIMKLEQLQPFGEGNKRPLFCIKNMTFNQISKIGKNKKHLKLNGFVNCVSFNCDKVMELITINQSYDLIFYPTINKWRDKETIQLIIYDYKLSKIHDEKFIASILAINYINECPVEKEKYIYDNFNKTEMFNYIKSDTDYSDMLITRNDVTILYKYLKNNKQIDLNDDVMGMNIYKVFLCMNVLRQLQIVDYQMRGFTFFYDITLHNIKTKLEKSAVYQLFAEEING